MKIVRIKWEDHFGDYDSHWKDVDRLKDLLNDEYVIESVGFLAEENDKKYILISNVSNQDNYANNIIILKATVLEYEELARNQNAVS